MKQEISSGISDSPEKKSRRRVRMRETRKAAVANESIKHGFRNEEEVERNGVRGRAAAGYPWCEISVAQKAM